MSLNFEDLLKEGELRDKESGVNNKPFPYKTSTGEEIHIPFPNAETYLALTKIKPEALAEEFQILMSDSPSSFNALVRDMRKLPVSALPIIRERMWAFWGNDPHKPAGNSKG